MQKVLVSLLVFILVGACYAEQPVGSLSLASPDKQFSLSFSDRGSFTLQDSHGAIVLSSQNLPELRDLADFDQEHVLWSPDSQILALAGGGGHDLQILVFVRSGDKFVLVSVPDVTDKHDNPHVLPHRWLKDHQLVLDISGPYAGKANGYNYTGKATIRVSTKPPSSKVLSRHITEHNDA